MAKFVASHESDSVKITHGSLLPAEIAKRGFHVFKRQLQSGEEYAIAFRIRIHRGYFDSEAEGNRDVYSDRFFPRWVSDQNAEILFRVTADGTPNFMISFPSGEVLHGEEVVMQFANSDVVTLKRCGESVSVSANGAITTVSLSVFSVISDFFPVWAEATAIAGIALSALSKRCRCLIEFKPIEGGEYEEKQEPFILADLPEIAFMLLDRSLQQPAREPGSASEQELVSQQPGISSSSILI